MRLYPPGSFDGNYTVSSEADLATATYVSAHEFGTREHTDDPGYVNHLLAQYIADHYAHMPLYLPLRIAHALYTIDPSIKPVEVFKEMSANTVGSKGGSWQEVEAVNAAAGEDGRRRILVGQAYHIGRVALETRKTGRLPFLPPDLPQVFDPESAQWWCRSKEAWSKREHVAIPYLWVRRKLILPRSEEYDDELDSLAA